jgi:hypothetical protein
LAIIGDLRQAKTVLEKSKRSSENTAAGFIYAPRIHALIALSQYDLAKTIELLQATVSYEQGEPPSNFFGFYDHVLSSLPSW